MHQGSTWGVEEEATGHDVLRKVNIIQLGKALNDEMQTTYHVLELKCML
jgi:hypothetical protein